MTLQEIQAMTDDEIRVRVAELMGWTHVWRGEHSGILTGYAPQNGGERVPPNYPADLNACASFEATFISDYERAVKYSWNLLRAIRLEVPEDADDLNLDYCWHIAHATARARCEAFLAVMQP